MTDPKIKQLRREVRYRFRRAHPIASTWPALVTAAAFLAVAVLAFWQGNAGGIVPLGCGLFAGSWAASDIVVNARLPFWDGSQ